MGELQFFRPISMAAILKLDTALALRENFSIRNFALNLQQTSSNHFIVSTGNLLPLPPSTSQSGKEDIPKNLQLHGVSQGTSVIKAEAPEAITPPKAAASPPTQLLEQAEEGKSSDVLSPLSPDEGTSAGETTGKRNALCPCPICKVFSTDSSMILSSHIIDCLSMIRNPKVARKRMRSMKDVIGADSPASSSRSELVTEDHLTDNDPMHHDQLSGKESVEMEIEPVKKKRRRVSTDRPPYRGIKMRSSGRWAAEINRSKEKIHLWLGTFETAEEAAMAYDRAAVRIRGSGARTNILSAEDVAKEGPVPLANGMSIVVKEGIPVVRRRKGRPGKRKPKPGQPGVDENSDQSEMSRDGGDATLRGLEERKEVVEGGGEAAANGRAARIGRGRPPKRLSL